MIHQIGQLKFDCLGQQAKVSNQVIQNHVQWLASKLICKENSPLDYPFEPFNLWYERLAEAGLAGNDKFVALGQLRRRIMSYDYEMASIRSCKLKQKEFSVLHQEFFELLNEVSHNINLAYNLYDYLTYLPSRKLFDLMVEKIHLDGVIMMADIDYFKEINDRYGHEIGDFVLRRIGRFFMDAAHDGHWVARYGGEEFVFYLPETDLGQAAKVAENLRRGVQSLNLKFGRKTCSFGLATVNETQCDCDYHRALHLADKALYQAKAEGRNRVVVLSQAG